MKHERNKENAALFITTLAYIDASLFVLLFLFMSFCFHVPSLHLKYLHCKRLGLNLGFSVSNAISSDRHYYALSLILAFYSLLINIRFDCVFLSLKRLYYSVYNFASKLFKFL